MSSFLLTKDQIIANKMSQLFSSASEVATFVVSSGLLKHSWAKIFDCYRGLNLNEQQTPDFSLRYIVYREAKYNFVAFVTSPICTKSHLQEAELVSSTALRQTFPLFEFLCSNGSSFSIHKAAIALFAAHKDELLQLKDQCSSSSNRIIITGLSLGGSVASLFTLLLLESLDVSAARLPLCLTFGSPLVGDKGFQQSIAEHPTWNSCFLHVAASKDSIPRLFIPPNNLHTTSQPESYKPFGTFLLCFETGCTCSENPEAISELLLAMGIGGTRNEEQIVNYGEIVEQLESWLIFKGISQLSGFIPTSLQAGIILQLEAIGFQRRQLQQQQNNEFDNLIKTLEKSCISSKRNAFDSAKKLSVIKVQMAKLEWYKKFSKDQKIGYYDCYKNKFSRRDEEVVMFKKILTNYWKKFVAENEKKPQKENLFFRTRWLYAGTNFRRMVEPLDIAEFYKNGQNRNYITNGRSDHYTKMEKWLEEAEKQKGSSIDTTKQNVDVILTYDSCFWAYVEEARICCKTLENAGASATDKESSRQDLQKFEQYVMEKIRKWEVSSEIFLKGSSFMQWWKEYEKIVVEGAYPETELTFFMKNYKYHDYKDIIT